MTGFDGWLGTFGGGNLGLAVIVALLMGLRHATDPDHLTAVSTLVVSDRRLGGRRASALGLAWGLGHAATLFVFGLPAVLFSRYLPETVHRAIEAAIGILIMALAVRLLHRWRVGYFHQHPHEHQGLWHSHPHVHEAKDTEHPAVHQHQHAGDLGRSPLAAFAIGLLHGAGGSAAAGLLVVGAASDRADGVLTLLVFAAATAVSMALLSAAFGYGLARGWLGARLNRLVPMLGTFSLLFGVWYAGGALH